MSMFVVTSGADKAVSSSVKKKLCCCCVMSFVVSLGAYSCQCAVSRTPKQFRRLTALNQNQIIHYHCNPSLLLQVYKDCYHSLLTEPEDMAQQVLQDIANWYSARIPT
uniref:Acylglycerol lipase n=1 Tax=Rhipicephalus zambeziensis TaxID=60191 RepID=A0A224YGV0_9ACAR